MMKIKDLLTKKNWIKHNFAVNKKGEAIKADDKTAVKFCLSGAIERVYPMGSKRYEKVYVKVLKYIGLDYFNILEWNDAEERKFEDVKKLIDELNI